MNVQELVTAVQEDINLKTVPAAEALIAAARPVVRPVVRWGGAMCGYPGAIRCCG